MVTGECQPPGPEHVDVRGGRGVLIGDGGTQQNYFNGREPISWPHRVGVVPPLADCRQQRAVDADVAAASATGQAVVVCQVVTGMGGVGKTQVAAALANRCWDDNVVDLLVWVTATSRDSILSTYAQAAGDVTGVDDPDPEQAAFRLLAWLAGTGRRWLIVLDDLGDPAYLRGLWPPTTAPAGRTVVATRRRDAALLAGRHVVPVGLFNPAEARTYLEHKLAEHPGLLDDADGLAADLGYLPLGLAQAAAYLLDRVLSCADYRTRLADRRRQLADLVPEDGALPDEHQATVAATWALSIDAADQLRPVELARPLIQLAAVLDPNGIPTTVFTTGVVCEYLTAHRDGARLVDADDVRDGLHALHRLNLITVDTDMVRVHALVQRAVREATPTDRLPVLATVAADALLALWPDVDHAAADLLALRANATTLADVAGDLLWYPDGHSLLYRAGLSLLNASLHNAAMTYWQRLAHQADRVLGDEHPDTLTVRANLAASYRQAGRTADAITIEEKVLTDRERILGDEHPDTLIVRANLAASYGQAGRTADAIPIQEEVATVSMRVLGDEHPDTLTVRANLADSYRQAGRTADAITIEEKVLTVSVRVLGDGHPDTLSARANLAASYLQVGRTADAIAIDEKVLAGRERVLGDEHPDTLSARANLAASYWQAGRTADATGLLERVVTVSVRVLGDEHPDTLAVVAALREWKAEA